MKLIDLTGQRFGRLLVEERVHNKWRCRCDCGNERLITGGNLRGGQQVSCGCWKNEQARARKGDRHPAWKGGRSKAPHGYMFLHVPDGPRRGRILEHIYVMQQIIGRSLLPDETVHHKNGNRSDNRPDNLELWSSRQPKGQRVDNKLAYAFELFQLYAPKGTTWSK